MPEPTKGEVPLVVRHDLNIIAATVAYYRADLIHKALSSDDTPAIQFGIGQHDVQMMMTDHDISTVKSEANYFGEQQERDSDSKERACSAVTNEPVMEMPSGAWLMDTGCACDLVGAAMAEGYPTASTSHGGTGERTVFLSSLQTSRFL